MMARLQELQARHECIGDVQGLGLVFGIEIVTAKATRRRTAP